MMMFTKALSKPGRKILKVRPIELIFLKNYTLVRLACARAPTL